MTNKYVLSFLLTKVEQFMLLLGAIEVNVFMFVQNTANETLDCFSVFRENENDYMLISLQLLGWARKSQTCGLQMIPIPHDPLALPYSEKSDPLRGPIFVPLNMKCLDERDKIFNGKTLFIAFTSER